MRTCPLGEYEKYLRWIATEKFAGPFVIWNDNLIGVFYTDNLLCNMHIDDILYLGFIESDFGIRHDSECLIF